MEVGDPFPKSGEFKSRTPGGARRAFDGWSSKINGAIGNALDYMAGPKVATAAAQAWDYVIGYAEEVEGKPDSDGNLLLASQSSLAVKTLRSRLGHVHPAEVGFEAAVGALKETPAGKVVSYRQAIRVFNKIIREANRHPPLQGYLPAEPIPPLPTLQMSPSTGPRAMMTLFRVHHGTKQEQEGPGAGRVCPDPGEGPLPMLRLAPDAAGRVTSWPSLALERESPAEAAIASPATETLLAQAENFRNLPSTLVERLQSGVGIASQRDVVAPTTEIDESGRDALPSAGIRASTAEPQRAISLGDSIRSQLERLADQKWGTATSRRVLEGVEIGVSDEADAFAARRPELLPGAGLAVRPEVEYRLEGAPMERVDRLGFYDGNRLLADMLETADEPVSIEIPQAALTARQVRRTRRCRRSRSRPATRFARSKPARALASTRGRLEVEILTSTGPASADVVTDGPPFSLRIQAATLEEQ